MRRKILLIDADPVGAVRFRRACDHVDLSDRLVLARDTGAAQRILSDGRAFGAVVAYESAACHDLERFAADLAARMGRSAPPIIALFDPASSLAGADRNAAHIAARLPRPRDTRAFDELACTLRDFWLHPPGRKLARWAGLAPRPACERESWRKAG